MVDHPAFLKNSIIIAAHPDDELLWFGAILDRVDQVLLVFEGYWPDPSIGPARAEAVRNFPRDNVTSLRIAEAATYGCANWNQPVISQYGIQLEKTCELRDAKQKAKRLLGKSNAPGQGIRKQYEENFEALVAKLRPSLKPDMNVFTHNPWGEYGHEDHLQVFRAVDLLRQEIGFTLWMSNYCTERALPLAMTYFDNCDYETIQLPVNKGFADKVAQTYRDAGCWTWSNDWNWFDTETYMRAPKGQVRLKSQGHLFPLNFFNIDAT